jgi:hypothetical protein
MVAANADAIEINNPVVNDPPNGYVLREYRSKEKLYACNVAIVCIYIYLEKKQTTSHLPKTGKMHVRLCVRLFYR